MRRPLYRRLTAFVLAFGFAGAVFGLPGLDALIYHTGHQTQLAEGPHFDAPGGCGAHAEHCALALAGALGQLVGAVSPPGRIVDAVAAEIPIAPDAMPRVCRSTLHPPSRAPPPAAS